MKSYLLLVLLALCSCGKNDPKSHPENSSNPGSGQDKPLLGEGKQSKGIFSVEVRKHTTLKEDYSNLEEFKDNINTFTAQFEVTSGSAYEHQINCVKSYFDTDQASFKASFGQFKSIVNLDLEVAAKDPSPVTIKCNISDKAEVVQSFEFVLNKSYIIENKASFIQAISNPNIHTLLIEEGATLITDGKDLEVKIDHLIALNGAKIITMTQEEAIQTLSDFSGRSGGSLNFEINKVQGNLVVELRGQNAGEVTTIPDPISEVPPKHEKHNGKCGNKGNAGANNPACVGKRGTQGYQGRKGHKGLDGGDSGALTLSFNQALNFEVAVHYFPGSPSLGGVGGQGGEGGPGGIGNKMSWQVCSEPSARTGRGGAGPMGSILNKENLKRVRSIASCQTQRRKYPNGKKGKNGKKGEQGDTGNEGAKLESSIIHLPSNNIIKFNSNFQEAYHVEN